MPPRSATGRSSTRKPSPPRRKTLSFKIRKEASPETEQPDLKPGTYPVYKLPWDKLKAFLQSKWPDLTFEERKVQGDKYIFDIPESLKSVDKFEIQKLRDDEPRRLSQSPEPM